MTKLLFGSYEFVEACAHQGCSPFDIDYEIFIGFDRQQMNGFTQAALSFLESYLEAKKGRYHSQALVRLSHYFETSAHRAYEMDGLESYRNTTAYGHMDATVEFIHRAIMLVEKYTAMPTTFRVNKNRLHNVFDELAKLIVETIFGASNVSSPVGTAWSIQRNTVWGPLFSWNGSKAHKIIALKVRRLLYDEIKEMDDLVNFRGARLLGFCLNVLGLKLTDRHRGFQREFYPLQAAAIGWVKANYRMLLAEHPEVAEACLQGRITYDRDNHRLVQTYSDRTGKEPSRDFLYLD